MTGNWWSGHKVLDPTELEARFATTDGLGGLDQNISEELSDESQERLERVRELLPFLPPREADFVDLYYFKYLKQTDIATIFRVSQPTVCYRLQRATSRMEWLLSLPHTTLEELESVLVSFLDDPLDIQIMLLMYQTTCQSEVAKLQGVSQGLVRHRFIRTIALMERLGGMDKYVEIFTKVSKNLNILREVKRPTGGSKITHILT